MKRKQPMPSTPASAPYWEAANKKKLLTQVCNDCQNIVFYPRYICPDCMSFSLDWRELPGTGTVYSYSNLTFHLDPAIAEKLPLVVALIELDNGPRVYSNIINANVDDVQVGATVKVAWEECEQQDGSEGYLPVYELA